MKTLNTFPFDINNHTLLEQWLCGLKKLKSSQAGSELHQMLQTLRQTSQPALARLAILDKLLEPTQYCADQLETLVLSESIKSRALAIKTAKLSSQLLSILSFNYCQISQSSTLDKSQQLTVLYRALQLIGLSLRKQAVFKQCPSSRLWKKSADLYRLALNNNLLEQRLPKATPLRTNQTNLIEVLQRNLLFSILNPYHFSSTITCDLFKFAERHFHLLKIMDSSESADFVWILEPPAPPRPYNVTYARTLKSIYLNSQAVPEYLTAEACRQLTPDELTYLRRRLTGYLDIMESIIPTAPKSYHCVFDYAQIHTHLHRYAAFANIYRISSEAKSAAEYRNVLQLEPLNAPLQSIQQSPANLGANDQHYAFAVSVYNTRSSNFVVISTPLLELQIDQPVLLIKTLEAPQLGFIKQIIFSSTHHATRLLVALVPGHIESINISIGTLNIQALLIKPDSGDLEVALPPGNYQNNTKVVSNSRTLSGIYYLDCLLNATPFLMRYRLIADQGCLENP